MSTRRLPKPQGYDLFKAAVTFILLFIVLIAVALNSGAIQAAEPEPESESTLAPVLDIAPAIGNAEIIAGCIEASGTGTPDSEVQIRSDDNILGSVDVTDDGIWSITMCVDSGNYRLMAVSINSAGAETSRSASLVVLVPEPTPVPTPASAEAEESAPTTETPPATEIAGDGQGYIVQQGDWLMGLARQFYGDAGRWEDIFNATNAKAAEDSSYTTLDNPNALVPGWKIWIPLP
jgi:hypothetical protein